MQRYFTTKEGAIRRLIGLQRDSLRGCGPLPSVVGTRLDGAEVSGIINVLADVRIGRLACYRHVAPVDDHIVFIS